MNDTNGLHIPVVCSPLEALIDYSTRVMRETFERVSSQFADDGIHPHLAPICLLHHSITISDGIRVSLGNSHVLIVSILLRSSFEATVSLKYMLQEQQETRGMSWLYVQSQQSAHIRNTIRKMHGYEKSEMQSGATTVFGQPAYGHIVAEYRRLKKAKNGRPPAWFNMFSNLRFMRELTKAVGWDDTFTPLWSHWSSIIHAGGAVHHTVAVDDDGQLHLTSQEDAHDFILTYAGLATGLLQHSTAIIVDTYGDEEARRGFEQWRDQVLAPAERELRSRIAEAKC